MLNAKQTGKEYKILSFARVISNKRQKTNPPK
jgi:hypothetical protein